MTRFTGINWNEEMYLALLNLGYMEILLILFVAILLFGGRLPEVARTVGRWFNELRSGLNRINRDIYNPPPPSIPERDPDLHKHAWQNNVSPHISTADSAVSDMAEQAAKDSDTSEEASGDPPAESDFPSGSEKSN